MNSTLDETQPQVKSHHYNMKIEEALNLVDQARGTQTRIEDLRYLPEILACVEAVQRVSAMYVNMGGEGKLSRQVVASIIESTQQRLATTL